MKPDNNFVLGYKSRSCNKCFRWLLLLCLILSGTFNAVVVSALVQMRVVKDTASYGYFGQNVGDGESANQLVASVQPANFSGPELMRKLVGKCYNLTEERYKYVFCPYENITQYELSPRWNAYQGILGIWSHWNIENNTFKSMVYTHGDHCGSIDRSVEVLLKCGIREKLINVTEPSKCKYSVVFTSRYLCHKDALLVYPRLNAELRKKWDKLLSDLHYGDITEKGYYSGLEKVFQSAGLYEVTTVKPPETTTTAAISLGISNTFADLLSCNKEYKNLQNEISQLNQEIEALKLLLDLSKMQNRTNKPQR